MTRTIPTTFVVERYWPGVTIGMVEAVIAREAALAREMSAKGRSISVLHTTLVAGDETVISMVVAESEADVAELGERSGRPADRIVPAVRMPQAAVTTGRDL